ncbi:MAG: hypothetical protein ACE5LL_05860 [Alphaproteobacteria bacterium]
MGRLSQILILFVVSVVLGLGVFLMTWDIPPPTATVERVLPDEHFPK